ncbi:hypothetical protein C1H21_18615 [Xanthomonas arboricola pv. juglandis]|nr:hypothetical protein C1H21_18615 [Xanthomonas arboricola pv. juglandis]
MGLYKIAGNREWGFGNCKSWDWGVVKAGNRESGLGNRKSGCGCARFTCCGAWAWWRPRGARGGWHTT